MFQQTCCESFKIYVLLITYYSAHTNYDGDLGFLIQNLLNPFSHVQLEPIPFLKGSRSFQKLSHLGLLNVLLEKGINLRREQVGLEMRSSQLFFVIYSSITFTVCVWGGCKVSFITFRYFSLFELAMQDSHTSLYITKTLYHFYIFDLL